MFSKVEDRPTPKSVYNWRITAIAVVASLASCAIGYDSAFIGTSLALSSFKTELGLASLTAAQFASTSANIVTTYQCGAIIGTLFGYTLSTLFGRKWAMTSSGAVGVLGAGLTVATTASTGLAPMYAGRTLLGVAVGLASSCVPLYLSEISPPAIRGRIVGFFELGWQAGGLVGFFINYGVSLHISPSHMQWIIPFYVQLIPAGLFLLMCPFFITESPRWLASKGRREQAVKNLCYLRQLDASAPYIIDEMAEIDAALEADRQSIGVGFFAPMRALVRNKKLLRRFFITTTLFLWQNGTGINAINYYSPSFFGALGLTGNTSLLTTGIYGVIKTIGALIWAYFIIDQFGRRSILLVGALGGGIAMLVIGIYNGVANPVGNPAPSGQISSGGYASIVFFYIWTLFYAVSWNGTPWVICSEVFAAGAIRQVTSAGAATSNWIWNLVIARATPTMFLNMGHSGFGVYLFFGVMQLISIVYIVLLLPETKRIPLEAMDRLWADSNKWTANTRLLRELQAEHSSTIPRSDSKDGSQDIKETEQA